MKNQTVEGQGPMVAEVVEGEPIRVEGRELVPLVRVTRRVRRQALVGSDRLGGQGWGFVHMKPVAILDRDQAGEHRIPIQNESARAIGRLLLAALVVPLAATLVVRLARWVSREQAG